MSFQHAKYKDPCGQVCPGGNPCCLSPEHRHNLCHCDDPDCFCHSQARYEPWRQTAARHKVPLATGAARRRLAIRFVG